MHNMLKYHEYLCEYALMLAEVEMADINYYTRQIENGSLNIAEDVIVSIVRAAALDVEGVAELASAAGADIAEFIGLKGSGRGVRIDFSGDLPVINVIITVSYGNNIVSVAKAVQDAVTDAVRTTAGIEELTVNVHVTGIAF